MAEASDFDIVRQLYPPTDRPPNCLICKHAQQGEQTICPYYGPVLDERLDAIGCFFFTEDPDAT